MSFKKTILVLDKNNMLLYKIDRKFWKILNQNYLSIYFLIFFQLKVRQNKSFGDSPKENHL